MTSFDRQLTPLFVDSLKSNSFFLLVFLVLLLRLWRGIMDLKKKVSSAENPKLSNSNVPFSCLERDRQ